MGTRIAGNEAAEGTAKELVGDRENRSDRAPQGQVGLGSAGGMRGGGEDAAGAGRCPVGQTNVFGRKTRPENRQTKQHYDSVFVPGAILVKEGIM